MAPVAVGAAPVEEALPIGTLKELPELKAPRVARRAGLLRRQLLEDREEETDEMAKRVQRHFRGYPQPCGRHPGPVDGTDQLRLQRFPSGL